MPVPYGGTMKRKREQTDVDHNNPIMLWILVGIFYFVVIVVAILQSV